VIGEVLKIVQTAAGKWFLEHRKQIHRKKTLSLIQEMEAAWISNSPFAQRNGASTQHEEHLDDTTIKIIKDMSW